MIIIRITTYVFAYFQEIKTKLKMEGIGYRIFYLFKKIKI